MNRKFYFKTTVIGFLCGIGILFGQTFAQQSESNFDISESKLMALPKGVVATYQGGQVTEKEWKDYLLKTPFQKKGSPLNPEDISWKHNLIKEYVANQVIYWEALKEKLDQTPEFKKAYRDLEERLLLDTLFKNEVREKAVPSDDEMKKYYDSHKEQFASPETFSIRHIFVDTSKTRKTDAQKAEALKKIKEAYDKLQKGEKFESIAKAYSESSPEDKRGEVNGPFKTGEILIDIETTALALQDGNYSNIISTKHGYTIVYLEEHKLAHINAYNDVKESVKNVLEGQRIPGLRAQMIKEAQENTKVIRHYEYLTDSSAKKSSVLVEMPDFKMTVGELRDLEKGSSNKPSFSQETEFLDGTVQKKQLLLFAEKLKLEKDTSVVKGLEDFKKSRLVDIWINKKVSNAPKLTDADIYDFYQKNSTRFVTQKQINASNIYIKADLSKATTIGSRAEYLSIAKDTADWILEQLKKGGDFTELAKKYSTIPNAKEGGVIGWKTMGPMGHRFDLVAFKLKKGDISNLVEMPDGYQIIKVIDIKNPQQQTFEEAKADVRQLAELSARLKLRDKILLDELKSVKLQYDLTRL